MEANQRVLELLTDLLIEQRNPKGWAPSSEDQKTLVEGLEMALVDRDSLREVLTHLQNLPTGDVESPELWSETEEAALLASGLQALYEQSPDRFYRLVTHPLTLLSLRDAIFDSVTPYWWVRISKAGGRRPRTGEEILEAAAAAGRKLELAALDRPQGPKRWIGTAFGDRVIRLTPADVPARTVKIEFTLTRQPNLWQLDIELLTPPPLGGSRWTGRLVSAGGLELGQVEAASSRLTFSLPSVDVLSGSELHCDYRRGESDHICFRLSVAVP